MKKKRLNKKLFFNKETITNLNMSKAKGGEISVTICRLSVDHYTCPQGDYTIGCESDMEPCFTEGCG